MRTETDDRANTIEQITRETSWLTPAQIVDLPLLEWKREGRIFSVEINDTQAYPRYQFDGNSQPLPIISDILKEFAGESDSWKIAAWFHFPNGYITAETPAGRQVTAPKDALDHRSKISQALQLRRGTYIA